MASSLPLISLLGVSSVEGGGGVINGLGMGDLKNSDFFRAVSLCLTSLFAFSATASEPMQTIQMLHEDFPPYIYEKGGQVVGSVAMATEKVFTAAGLSIKWQQTNYGRLRRELSVAQKPFCATGYSLNHDRIGDTKVVGPIAQAPKASIAIRSSDLPLFQRHATITDILQDPNLGGGFIKGLNYQGVSRDLMASGFNRHIIISGTETDLAMLVARKRIDYAIINRDQTDFIRAQVPLANELITYEPEGMRPAWPMYIICSGAVSSDIWEKINQAVEGIQS
jgi:hypothetical protein